MSISIDNLADTIGKELTLYNNRVVDGIKKEAKRIFKKRRIPNF